MKAIKPSGRQSDLGTDQLKKHKGRVVIEGFDGIKRARVKKISVLDMYFNKEKINFSQYNAGKKLYSLYYAGILSMFPSVTQNLNVVGHGGSGRLIEPTVEQLNIQQIYYKALHKLTDKEREVVTLVSCDEVPIYSKYHHRKREEALKLLKSGLNKIARHFGF